MAEFKKERERDSAQSSFSCHYHSLLHNHPHNVTLRWNQLERCTETR